MGQKINIPSQNQPFRKQSSLGGDVSFRNLNGTNDNSFITLAKVTKVYYKQGKLDFKLTNTVSIVQEQGGDGSGSAPIPVDFFGRKPDGQVFGHYRPVKVGDLIAIAYINGHRSNPIVIGVYPDSAPDYELISPSMFETGDDNDSGIAETGLAEQKVYPSMQTSYRSGSGTIAEALNGHSFLILDDETANQYDQLWTDYESVGFFNHNGETTNPLKEEAGSWLLVHEDNPDGDGDGHRTRFYVNPKGEIQIVLMGSDSEGDVSVLEGSRKDGFTLKHYNDLSSIKAGDKGQDVYNPDFDVAKKYVELNIGKDQSILMQAVDQGFSGGNTNLTVRPDGVYLNDKPLNASITDSVREHSKEVADAISKDLTTTKEWEDFDKRVTQAGKDAKDAGDKAKQAGEDAKQAGINAEKAGEDAKKTGEDIKRHIVYYASAFPQGDHYIPGKYLAINTETYIANGIIKSAMIEDGAIDNAKIAYEAVGSSQIEDLAVTRGKLAYMAVGTAQIEDLAVSDEKVDHLSFNHMEGELLDAHKIRVRNLSGDSISAKTLTADKLIIGELGDITDKLGTIADGKIIVKGNGSNSGVSLEGLDADNPDVYTPSKKAILANIVRAIRSSAEASLDYAKQVGLSNDPVAIDLQNKYDAMVDGLAPIFNDMTATTNFDHNTVEQLTSDCNNAIDKFQNLANSQLNRKIGQTADNKNSVYQGYEQPANPHINDIWFQENSDGTYQIRVYDGGSWISPGMQDIKEVQESVSTLPRSYYSSTQPTGTDYKDGDIWYKTSTDTTNNTVVYTAYKWNRNTNTWDPLLDATSSHNYIGSAPANPIDGDFWMDNTTLKQYQNGVWKTIPTQGPQGVPGVSAKQQYTHIAYATSANGENFSSSTFSGATYIGLLVDFNEEDSSDPTKYAWSLMKGADGTDGRDGVPGKPGADGKTSYVHFAYANSSDGKTGFNLVYFNGAKYIGIYSDFTEADSDDYTKYTWSLMKGADGTDGKDGVAGKDGVGLKRTEVTYGLSESDSTQPSRWSSQVPDLVKGQYLWSKTVWFYTDDTSETGYQKTYIAKDGNDGTDGVAGKDGVGISSTTITYAVGTSGTTAPTSGWDSQVPNVPTGQYLWTKTIWSYTDNTNETGYSVAKMGDTGPKGDPGKDGVPGAKGADGKTYYTWIKYATDSSGSNISDSPIGMSYIGIAYNKESQTESSTPTDYTWTKIKGDDGIPGKPGADGKTSYFHIAYANSSDGKDGFYVGGGRNLLVGSDPTLSNRPNLGGVTEVNVDGVKAWESNNANSIGFGSILDANTTYTYSALIKADAAGELGFLCYGHFQVYNSNAHNKVDPSHEDVVEKRDYHGITVPANQWTKICYTFTTNDLAGSSFNVYPSHVNGHVYIRHLMLEKGTVAHDWSPAPSEVHPLYMGTYTDYTQAGSTDPTRYTWVPMFDSTKKRNFTTQPTTPYAVGDTWTQSGATYFCTTARDSGAFRQDDWEMQQLTIHSLAPSVTNSLYNDNLLQGTAKITFPLNGNQGTQTIQKYDDETNYIQHTSNTPLSDTGPWWPWTPEVGQVYTFSADVAGNGYITGDSFRYEGNDSSTLSRVDLTDNWQRISNTFRVNTIDGWHNWVIYANNSTLLKVKHIKIEKGSVATPWCLSQSELTTTTRDYRGVTLNDGGLTATAGSTRVAMNSNDGFLINNASGQVFHVDTSGNLNMKGNITAGNISGVNFTGNNLTLNNSLQVINGKISADNGNVVINSNGLTIKDGGLKIVNGNNETTTEIRDDGTFATNKGFFSGTITGSSIVLNGSDGSKISASGGAFSVDGFGNVTANSISITGNRKDDVSNLALIKGANITDGNIIKGNLIEGNNIIGNRIQSSEFMTSTREYSNGSYYPISGSIYTPSFLIEDSGNISVHTVFPQAFSTIARIGSNKGVDGPYVNITHEAFDRSTLSGSFGYGRGYEYPVPYLYGHQGGMVEYPVNSNELSIVYMNDISRSEYNGYGLYDGYKYTEIATINDIVQKYKSKIGRIKFNFGIVCTYGSYDTSGGTTTAGGYHDLYVVLTTGRINENDTYHVDFDGKTFNNVRNNIKIKMTSKKVLTGVGGLSYYNLYAELSTKDLDLANTYYLGVLQKGFIKDSRESLANHTWKIQIDEMAIIPEGDILDDQGYYVPTAGGSYRDLAISANGSIITHEDDIGVQTTSEYNSRYLSFAVSTDGQSPMPYWTTINADGIGFSIGNNNSSTDGNGNPNGLATRQCIYFSGDSNQNGMSMDNYGNVHGQVGSGIWRIYNNQGDEVFDVPFDPNGVFNFYVPRVNKNTDPNHKWGGLKIGWVYFDQPRYRWAETVPAIYNTGGRVKGIAMFDQYLLSFVDGWCYPLSSWWNHGVPKGVDSSNGEAEGTNTDAGHRGV